MTQQPTEGPTSALANVTDQASSLANVKRAQSLGKFPGQQTEVQLALLAEVALALGLNPIFEEIMPYQGKPFITIKGRRRLDADAGHKLGISFRPPTEAEEAYWARVGAMDPRDVIQIAVGTDPDGNVTEAIGRLLWSEDEKAGVNSRDRQAARDNLPIVMRKIEMAQKRGEARLRDMVFGPPTKMAPFRDLVVQEGYDGEVIEGEARVVDEPPNHGPAPEQSPLPDMGNCVEHGVPWSVRERYTKIEASHKIEDSNDWCQLGKVYAPLLEQAWIEKWPSDVQEGIITKEGRVNINTWLKNTFNGRTWSKLDAPQMVRAVSLLIPAPVAPETDIGGPEGTEMWETSDELAEAQETAQDATERNRLLDAEIVKEQAAQEH